jgi:hypothetical protein
MPPYVTNVAIAVIRQSSQPASDGGTDRYRIGTGQIMDHDHRARRMKSYDVT